METDILVGAQLGYQTTLVLTGGTTRILPNVSYPPDHVIESVADLSPEFFESCLGSRQGSDPTAQHSGKY